MRNRTQKPAPDVVAEVTVKHEPDERLDALLEKLDAATVRIASLEDALIEAFLKEQD